MLKGEMDNKIIGGDFNTLLKSVDPLSRHKIRKETVVLSDTLDQIYIDHSIPNQQNRHSFQGHVEQSVSRIGHTLGHRTSVIKFKKTEIISNIFSNHSGRKLDINYYKTWKKTRQLNMILNSGLTKKSKRKSENN